MVKLDYVTSHFDYLTSKITQIQFLYFFEYIMDRSKNIKFYDLIKLYWEHIRQSLFDS